MAFQFFFVSSQKYCNKPGGDNSAIDKAEACATVAEVPKC